MLALVLLPSGVSILVIMEINDLVGAFVIILFVAKIGFNPCYNGN